MNLEGKFVEPQKTDKNKKIRKIIIIAIIILFIALIGMSVALVTISKSKLTLTVNGQLNSNVQNMLKTEEDEIYVPIRDIASTFKYESYNGNYINKSEETNQCYVETSEEVAIFTLGEDNIQKVNTNTKEITTYHIEKPVKMIDGKLYTTTQGIEIAFNCNFNYYKDRNKITINTMQYLIDYFKNSVLQKGYKEISEEFNDQKAILDNLVIVKDDKKQFGVINLQTNADVLECKYSSIKYIPETKDFLVESDKKLGIKTNEGKDRIKVEYDSLELISQESKLYVVSQDDYYGVINQNGEEVIPIKFDQIGMDVNNYEKNNVNNKYILLDKIIPVMKNDIWMLYNKDTGKRITNKVGYEKFGSSKVKNTDGILVFQDYNIIVGYRDKKYYLINEEGEELYALNKSKQKVLLDFEEIYMETDVEGTKYTLVKNNQKLDAIETLEELKNRGLLNTTTSSSDKTTSSDKTSEE